MILQGLLLWCVAYFTPSLRLSGGSGEIRTHGGRKPSTVFKTVALNRSATLPLKRCASYEIFSVLSRLQQHFLGVLQRGSGNVFTAKHSRNFLCPFRMV